MNVDAILDALHDLPDGLSYQDGIVSFRCRTRGTWAEWPVDVADFDIFDSNNLCGGSPQCCP